MRHTPIGPLALLVARVSLGAQTPMLPAPAPPPSVTVVPSVAAESGVRLALVQPPEAPVVIESVAHTEDRLAGVIHVRNQTNRTASTVVLAFTIGAAATPTTPAFRHVEAVALTLGGGQTASLEVPGIPLRLLRSLIAADAPLVEIAMVGVRFTSGPAWRAPGRGSWLGRPDLTPPLACVDDLGQTQTMDPQTAITAGTSVCQGGGQ